MTTAAPRPSIWQRVVDGFRPIERQPVERAQRDHVRPRGLGANGQRMRLSQDRDQGLIGVGVAVAAPLSPAERWRDLDLSSRTLDRVSASELLELLADVSPEVSRALWDFLRMCNPGYEAVVLRPSGSPAPSGAQAVLRDVLTTISEQHGDFNIAVNRLFLAGFLRGGFFAELILDKDGRQTLGLATPDPATLRWRQVDDEQLGQRWQMGQMQKGRFVAFDQPTLRYLPIDPLPGQPQGRAPANPAIFPTVFMLAMLQDVRRVVQQQGWPRLDIEVVLENLVRSMPEEISSEPGSKAYKEWVDDAIADIAAYYASLEPDDAFVHTDDVQLKPPVGAVDGASLAAIPQLITVLERQAIRALKTMPLLMGVTDGVSEANANRQWDIHLAGIRSLQHLVENLLGRLLTLAIQAQGVPGVVKFTFAEAQVGQRERNAKVEELEIRNALARYLAGWISQDDAAMAGASKERPDAPAPRGGAGAAAGGQQSGGESGGTAPTEQREMQPIMGYHIETGVVSRNEARAPLGLPAQDDTLSEQLRKLREVLAVTELAKSAGIAAEVAFRLTGLDKLIEAAGIDPDDSAAPPPVVAPPPIEEETEDGPEEEPEEAEDESEEEGEGGEE